MGILSSLSKAASSIANAGQNFAAALMGNYKSTPVKKGLNRNLEPIDADSVSKSTQVLGLIYRAMVRAREEELIERTHLEIDQKKQRDLDDERNEELIKALTVRRKPKKKPVPKKKEEKKKEEPKKPPAKPGEKPPAKPGEKPPAKPGEKPPAKPSAEKAPVKEAPKPEVKPSAKEVKPEAPKVPEKVPEVKAPKPSAEKEPTIGKGAISTAVGAAGVFASAAAFAKVMMPFAEQASQKLGGKIPPIAILAQWAGESGNGKNLSAPFNYAGIKAGKNDKKGDYVLTQEFYTDAQLERAKKSGETLDSIVEFGDKIKKNGKMVDAWEYYGGPGQGKRKYEETRAQGKELVNVKSYFAKFDNPQEFVDRYVGFLSSSRYAKAREATTPAQFGSELATAGYTTSKADTYSKGLEQHAKNYQSIIGVPTNQALPASLLSTGSKIDQASKENKDMKSALVVKAQTNVNTTNVNVNKSSPQQVAQQEEIDDRPPIYKKS